MLTDIHNKPALSSALLQERMPLLRRVSGSVAFQKSNRMQELLLFLGEHALQHPGRVIREHEIGVEVFGRPADYDTSQDTIVRVQVSQLRRKLQQYFEAEGKDEPLVLELPKGSYTLLFHPRGSEPADGGHRRSRRATVLPWVVALVLAAASVTLGFQNWRLRQIASLGLPPQPAVDRLWQSMFANGQPTHLVIADGNLTVFQDMLVRMLTLPEYQDRAFERLARERIQDPALRAVAMKAISHRFTGIADAILVHRIGLLSAVEGIRLDVVSARDMTQGQVFQHNTILTGSRRANPWVSLFEDQLNFRTVFEEMPRSVCFVNTAPLAGEAPRYCGQWSQLAYCRVAYLPNAKREGSVLLVSGTDVHSTEAGGYLVTKEVWVRRLRQALGVRDGEDVPHFEALLRGAELGNTTPQFDLVAVRRH